MNNEKIEELSKNVRITEEYARLSQRFVKADANKRTVIEGLIRRAAFMRITLEDLEEIINEEGATEAYKNGANQYGQKMSSTLQSYNSLIKNYTAVIKSLTSIVPNEEREPAPSPLDLWRARREELENPSESPEERVARLHREWDESVRQYKEEHPDKVEA